MGAIGIILIASFAIDRIVSGLFFLMSYSRDLYPLVGRDAPAEGVAASHADERAARTKRLVYAIIGGYLGTVVIAGVLNVRLFAMTKFAITPDQTPSPLLDTLLTGLILAGGADRLAEALKLFSGSPGEAKSGRPVEITGKLVLAKESDEPAASARTAGSSIT